MTNTVFLDDLVVHRRTGALGWATFRRGKHVRVEWLGEPTRWTPRFVLASAVAVKEGQ